MTWDDFYDRFYDWSETTQRQRISSLKEFGASSEVTEIATDLMDEKLATKFIEKAIDFGVRFTPKEIIEIIDYVQKDVIAKLVKSNSETYTEDEFYYVCDFISDEEASELARKNHIKYDIFYEEELETQEEIKEQGLFGSLLVALGISHMFGKYKGAVHNGRCNGECENCPAHYGYRYGRWYYGHHHSEGCEFGGNK